MVSYSCRRFFQLRIRLSIFPLVNFILFTSIRELKVERVKWKLQGQKWFPVPVQFFRSQSIVISCLKADPRWHEQGLTVKST